MSENDNGKTHDDGDAPERGRLGPSEREFARAVIRRILEQWQADETRDEAA